MHLLDTDTIIYALKGDSAVIRNIERHANDPMKICTVTLIELYYGAHKSQRKTTNLAKVKTIEKSFEVLPLGPDTAEIFGMLKADLESSGKPLDDFDLSIAACAMAHNLTLITNNLRHFSRIKGLKYVSWAKD